MKTFRIPAQIIAIALLVLGLAPQNSSAQSTPPPLSVSPGDLSFGVPTVAPFPTTGLPLASAPETVTVNIPAGLDSVSFTSVIVAPSGTIDYSADFHLEGSSCTGLIASPNTCQVTLHFNASLAPATTLETATLSIASSAGSLSVPLNGAYGAIELFSALNVNPSLFSPATWPGQAVKTATLNLSCPAGPTAILSSTPDGLSNVFQDNTIQVANTYGTTPTTVTTANVCYGGDTNFQSFTGFPKGTSNCFQPAYESAATGFLGQNPDLAPGLLTTYGVQPLNLMSPPYLNVDNDNDADDHHPLFAPVLVSGAQSLTVQLIDAGGELGAATLHLVTNCSLAGVTPGGSITGNPINSSDPSSQTQNFSFDNGGGQNISITTSSSVATQQGSVTIPSGTIPIITDIGVPQALFNQLVAGTSAAPSVCLRLAGELDPFGQPMCKGYLIQCKFTDPTTGITTITGDNCAPTASTSRNLYDAVQFTSPDAPAGYNFLTPQNWSAWAAGNSYSAGQSIKDPNGYIQLVSIAGTSGAGIPTFSQTVGKTTIDGGVTWTNQGLSNACANVVSGGTCLASSLSGSTPPPFSTPTLIGPGLLLGGDNWLCTAVSAPIHSACTPVEANTQTPAPPAGPPTYSVQNCFLTGALTGFTCPLDALTAFLGAADARSPGTTTGSNSIYIPVVNMPLPYTVATITGLNTSGWVNSLSFKASFVANPATYPGGATNPGANAFQAAPPYSVTYGLTPAQSSPGVPFPLPDTTYPVPTDAVQYAGNSTVYHNSDPILASLQPPSITNCSAPPPNSFTATDNLTPSGGEGIYNLHYFTTDCALSEGLVFNPTPAQLTNPTANWASFQFSSAGLDNVAPILSCYATGSNPLAPPSPNGKNGWYLGNVSVSCSATDDLSGFAPGTAVAGTNPLAPVLQGSTATSLGPFATSVPPGGANPAALIPPQVILDLAGNSSNTYAPSFPIDMSLPTIGVTYIPSQTLTVGQSGASITHTCADTGSGVATCPAPPAPPALTAPPACPAANAAGPLTFSSSYPINTSSPGTFSFYVTSTDCAGNVSASVPVSYTVVAAPADLAIGEIPIGPDNISRNTVGHYYAAVIDLSSPTANNVVITSTFTVPNNVLNGGLTASYALVSCKLTGCTIPSSGTSCTVNTTVAASTTAVITCNVGHLPSVFTGKGLMLAVNIPVLSTAAVNTKFTSTTKVSSANDPNSSNNSVSETYIVTK